MTSRADRFPLRGIFCPNVNNVARAMCWFFGRQISDGLSETGDVPVGLIASDWGGTALSQWTPADAVADCAITKNCTGKGWIGGDHYNAMVHPFTVGPMRLAGFAW